MKKNPIRIVMVAFISNAILFAIKIIVGLSYGSMSLVADAVNNLSDFFTTLIMLVGIKMASKPADNEHPYGHQRIELIGGMLVSLLFLYAAYDVINSSLIAIQKPNLESITPAMWLVTVFSIGVKLMMMLLYNSGYRTFKSQLLEAGGVDSRNDILVSIALIIGFAVQSIFGVIIDGYLGLLIGILILVSALQLLISSMTVLVGKRASQQDIDEVVSILDQEKRITGYHDLRIHTYGSNNKYGSVHAEVDGSLTLFEAHDIADSIEKSIYVATQLELIVHLDPVDFQNAAINDTRKQVSHVIKSFDFVTSYHDFQMNGNVISFDVVVMDNCKMDDTEILNRIKEKLKEMPFEFEVDIDRNYLLKKDA